jgi:hypothetical protein
MLCGLLLAESVNLSVADRFPVVVGAKMMFAVQLDEAESDVPQVLLNISKSPGFVPAKPILLMVITDAPVFVNVTTFCPPLPPTGTETQFKDVGDTDPCAINAEAGNNRHAAPMLAAAVRSELRRSATGRRISENRNLNTRATRHKSDFSTGGPPANLDIFKF